MTDDLEALQSRYQRLFPEDIAKKAAALQNPTGPHEVATHLEAVANHILTTLLVVGARLAADGDAEATTVLESIRGKHREYRSLGHYLGYFDLWNDTPTTREIFDPDDLLAPADASFGIRFALLWQRLLKEHGPPAEWDLSVVDELAVRAALDGIELQSLTWLKCATALLEARNKLIHKDLGKRLDVVPKVLVSAFRLAALQIAVTGPPATLLDRYRLGTKTDGREIAGRGDVDVWTLTTSGREMHSDRLQGLRITKGELWVLEVSSTADVYGDVLSGQAVGLWRTPEEILLQAGSDLNVNIDAKAEAWLTAGVVDFNVINGQSVRLPLPVAAVVTVTPGATSAMNWQNLDIEIRYGASPAQERRLTELGLRAAKATLKHLRLHLTDKSPPVPIPAALTGAFQISLPQNHLLHLLGLDRAVVLAIARSIARSVSDRLPDELQSAVMREIFGDTGASHRDYFGWVDTGAGGPVGRPMSCPSVELLLLVPTGTDQRIREVRLPVGPDDGDLDPTIGGDFLALCDRTTTRMETTQAHPLVSLLRPMRGQFGADAILTACDSWVAGLAFSNEDHRIELAESYLNRQIDSGWIPPSIRIVRTASAWTTADT